MCGGFLGIYIATAILSAILGIAIYFTNAKLTKNNLLSFIITIGTLYFMRDYIAARAQLFTFILFILTIFFIEKFLETRKKRYAIALFIIPVIIANVHVAVWPFYFVLYLPYIAEYLVSLIADSDVFIRNMKIKKLNKKILKETEEGKLEKLKEKLKELEIKNENSKNKKEKIKQNPYKVKVTRNKNVKWLIIIMIICIFTGLLTPLKGVPYTYLINTMRGNTTQFINEHLPLTLINNIEFMAIVAIFILILIFTDTKIKLSDLFMIAGLLLLSLKTRRQISMFLLIGTVMLNRLVCALLEKYDKDGCERFTRLMVTIIGRIITVAVIILFSYSIVRNKIGNEFVSEASYPTKAVEFIKENLDLKNMKLYNEYNYGSYLLFNDIPVFIDSRADLYTKEFNGSNDIFSDFIDINNIGKYYEETMEKYGITHVMQHKNSRLNMFISRDDNYKEIYSDDYFIIYERNK